MFGFFKKKKDEQNTERPYDPTNLHVNDLRLKWQFDYDQEHWEVLEEQELNWGGERFSQGFVVCNTHGQELYMELENERKLKIFMYNFLEFGELDEADAVADAIAAQGAPPRSIYFEDDEFIRQAERPCYHRSLLEKEQNEVLIWEYWNANRGELLRIEQWGEEDFELLLGWPIGENEITDILPVNA